MAHTTREPVSSLRQLAAAAAPLSHPTTTLPNLRSLADSNLSELGKPPFLKYSIPPQFQPSPLTGAAAIEDNRRHKEEMEKGRAQMSSPNPARIALMRLTSPGMSKPEESPRSTPFPRPKQKPSSLAPSFVAEPMHMDEPSHGPAIMSSPLQMSAPSLPNPQSSPPKSRKRPASPREEERPNKALTYPPRASMDEDSAARNMMSFPHPSSITSATTTSSGKKHKCLHCDTEFTRHHNLKSHLLTHSQEKPFGCQECTSRFRRLHDLKRHLKLHTGDRPHGCPKCGRKFARGDALARHNKGPGGCAGRRDSGGEGDEYGDGMSEMDTNMEDASFEDEDGRKGGQSAHQYDDPRRQSAPDRARRDSVRGSKSGSYHQHSSTYPGVAPMSTGLYSPQSSSNQSTVTSAVRTSSRNISPKAPPAPGFSAVQYNPPSYAGTGMTESPKPLSPGQPEPHRHSSSISSQLQLTRLGSTSSSFPTQLPPLTTVAEAQYPRQPTGPPITIPPSTFTAHPPSGPVSATGSLTSNHQSSGGSMREILGPQDASMWEHVRNMQKKMDEMAAQMREQSMYYESEMARLKEEVMLLRGPGQRQDMNYRGQQGPLAPSRPGSDTQQ